MGRTACTEPQCLYKGDLYLYLTMKGMPDNVVLVKSFLIPRCNSRPDV